MVNGKAPIKVLSVVGAGRSGTTLLASILSEVEGFVSAGELRWLWQRGVLEQRPCGCGKPPSDCPVWAPVIAATLQPARDGTPTVTVDEIIAAQQEVGAARNRLRVLRSTTADVPGWNALTTVRQAVATACNALARETGSSVVIDTSKRPHDAAVVARLPEVQHYIVHLVRDPRAVVHSWRQAKAYSVAGKDKTMAARRLPSTVRRWWASGLGTEVLLRQLPEASYLRMRYEDFCLDPRGAVGEIISLLDETGSAPFEDKNTVLLHPNHIVAGNPSRFTVGSVEIRTDDRWRAEMPRRDQRLVGVSTEPLLRRYGYRIRPLAGSSRSRP
ncbi:MAG: sulfotransferase [Nocardioidaceae bacterium]